MSRMTCLLVLVLACKQKPAEEMAASPGTSGAMGTAGDMGSAMGAKPHDAAGPKTADDLSKRFDECIRFANEGRTGEHRNCYAGANAMAQLPGDIVQTKYDPQLVLISDATIIALVHVTATDAKTKQPIAFLLGDVIETDTHGKFTREEIFYDPRTPAAPLATKNALIAKHDDVELANLAAYAKQNTAEKAWAAGDHVAAIERGTDRRSLVVHRFASGTPAQTWMLPAP